MLENKRLISTESELVDIFNEYYINIVKYSSGKTPIDITTSLNPRTKVDEIIDKIVDTYKDHASIQCINKTRTMTDTFSFKQTTEKDVILLLKSIDSKKSIDVDLIPPLIIKEAAEVLAKPLTNLINQSIRQNEFPSKAKIAAVLPFFKKDDRCLKNNYRPVSVLSALSKIFEKILKHQIVDFMDSICSPYVSAYRKNYSTHHVLIRLLEEWRKGLDDGYLVGAILMDLSKAFDCIPHDLLIAKLHAYGFQKDALKYIYSYLKGRRQGVKINGVYSKFLSILAGVPQGSILGPILFNIFINDFYYFIQNASLHGFADDHTISKACKSLEILKEILRNESNIALNWLHDNMMIANPSKFQAIVFSKSKDTIITSFHIKDKVIESKSSVELLGIKFDNKLKFEEYISGLCRKSSGQLNALCRFKSYLSHESKILAINSFISSNFNYCPLIWHFSTSTSEIKIEKIQERALRFICNNGKKNYDDLLKDQRKCKMKIKRMRTLATEIFKTLHHLNPIYMEEIFYKSKHRRSQRRPYDINVPKYNQTKYGRKSLRVLGPMLWNSLPNRAKSLDTLSKFKTFINTWGEPHCPHYQKFISYDTAV